MTQPIDLITQSLINIGAVALGDKIPSPVSNQAFNMLNMMLDQWSTQDQLLFCEQEVIHEITPNKYIYNIGPNGDVNCVFTGSITGSVLTVTAITSGALCVGQTLTGTGIVAGTTITSYQSGTGGNSATALGTYNLSQPNTFLSGSITANYPRPLRINSGFVRINNSVANSLDYTIRFLNFREYQQIGIKTLAGPWPTHCYYQPSMPNGVLTYWPNPSQGEMHLYCQMLLGNFKTINDTVNLPQGYALAIIWCLSEILMPSYGKKEPAIIQMVMEQARQGRAFIKRNNANPQPSANFDSVLSSRRAKDAGWILNGGFLPY